MTSPRRTRPPRRRGFTLLEVLVALAIFSVGMLALVPLFSMVSWGARGGRDVTRATTLARAYVDKLRNTPYGNVLPCASACTPPAGEVADNAPYDVTWTVTEADGAPYDPAAPPTPDMKRVTVRVTCATCARKDLTIRMVTLIASRS